MNLLHFFTFITCSAVANLVQLCNHHGGHDNHSLSSCPSAHHSILNLVSIRRVAVKMNSTCLVECGGTSSNLQKLFDDPAFLELCSALGRTYEKLHKEDNNLQSGSCFHGVLGDPNVGFVSVCEQLNSMEIVGSTVSNSGNLISLINCILGNFLPLLDDSLASKLGLEEGEEDFAIAAL